MQYQLALITRQIDHDFIGQRASDGFIDATAMCKAAGKLFADYKRNAQTEEYLRELATDMGFPISGLIVSIRGGNDQGTWVHPDVAVHLAQWCSPKFAVAVSRWVREWISGNITQASKLPYHLERYLANRASIPHTHWSMLNELTFGLIAPLEQLGYHLPERLIPDISEGKMFCKWLRDVKGIDTNTLPKYKHVYADGRVVEAKLYPLSLLEDFRQHFHHVWMPEKAVEYFHQRDPKALQHLAQLFQLPENPWMDDETAKDKFNTVMAKVAAVDVNPPKLK